MSPGATAESPPAHGVVELREDVPLKAGGSDGGTAHCCAGGPRLILACFAALSAAITLALLTQIYSGDYEVVPHGSVSCDAEACSRAGTDALKDGGRALDAAVAAALCLAVVAPHRTSLDAGGSLVYWEYRQARTTAPTLAEWGAAQAAPGTGAPRPPRLVAALAALHAERGVLPWPRLLQPAIVLARDGFLVSEGLAAALAAAEPGTGAGVAGGAAPVAGSLRMAPSLASFLRSLQFNTSRELTEAWGGAGGVRQASVVGVALGAARVYAGAARALRALTAALQPPPLDLDDATRRVVSGLRAEAADAPPGEDGVAAGMAVVDRLDTYVALVTGTSVAFGSGPETAAGWRRDEPVRPLDLAPAVLVDGRVCGTRYVVGAESGAALAQAAAALAGGASAAAAVERARVAVRSGGALAAEAARAARLPAQALPPAAAPLDAPPPYAAVNLVQQTADALLSYADSRGGGIASRF